MFWILLIDTTLLAVAAWAIAHWCGPSTTSARLAAFLIALQALIVLTSEAVGRFVYTPVSLSVASAVLGIVGLAWLRRNGSGSVESLTRSLGTLASLGWLERLFLLGWVAMLLFGVLAVTTVPPTANDAVRYHLTMGVSWLQQGSLSFDPLADYRVNHFPHNVEILNAWALVLSRNWRLVGLPQVALSGLLWPLAAFLAMRLCRVGLRLAVVGGMLASMSAPVVQLMRNEGVDVGMHATLILALVAALSGRRFYRRPLAIFAIAIGLALGTKSSGPLALAVGLVALFAGWWLDRREAGAQAGTRVRELAAAAAVVALLGAWVYGANVVAHRNPFYPMALKLGPVTLPTASEDLPVYYNPWVHDYGLSPAARLTGALARWPRLLLGLEPFDKYNLPFSGGFGPLMTVNVALLVLVCGYRLLWLRGPPALQNRSASRWPYLIGLLLLWNLALVSIVSVITSPTTHVDARYQLHLALVVPLLLALAAGSLPRAGRTALTVLLLAAFLFTGHRFNSNSRVRGWPAVTRTLKSGDALLLYHRPRFYPVAAEHFFEIVGESEPLMVGNRGLSYPFYLPMFERRIYLVSAQGPISTLAALPPIAPAATAGALTNYDYWWNLGSGSSSAGAAPGRPKPQAYNSKGIEIRRNTAAYYEAVATGLGVRFLLVERNLASWVETSPNWRKVELDRPDDSRKLLLLYEFVGAP